MTPPEVVTAIGLAARAAARSDDPAGDFDRDQLLSAYSATRHLAVELRMYPAELARFQADLLECLRATPGPEADAAATRIEEDRSPSGLGDAISDLLAGLRAREDAEAAALRTTVQGLVRRLSDREVELMAEGLSS